MDQIGQFRSLDNMSVVNILLKGCNMWNFAMKEIFSAYEEVSAINTNLKYNKGNYKIII